MTMQASVGRFVQFSAAATGFSEFDLFGTGQAGEYYTVVEEIVGKKPLDDLLAVFEGVVQGAVSTPRDAALRQEIFSDPRLGPIARNVLKLWYLGTWYEMPTEWRAAYGVHLKDTTRVVSPIAYTEGLLWPAIGANPSGAKAPGYGSWQYPPKLSVAPGAGA